MAIVYALCCLGFAAVNDFLFKLFANGSEGSGERRSCGRFVMLVGVVDTLFMASLLRGMPERMGATLLWGVVSGVLSVASNILVIESMRHQSAGVSSTIFRLNLVLVVVGGCALFDEAPPKLSEPVFEFIPFEETERLYLSRLNDLFTEDMK